MENQAPYVLTMLVTPPVYCALSDALTATLEGLQLAASHAGLPKVDFSTQLQFIGGQRSTRFSLLATTDSLGWQRAPAQGYGATLAEAEQAFYAALRAWEEGRYEEDASCWVDAQIESYQQLEAYA